uniref:Mucin-13 isoform X5 n=1 Tax=Geotrypetes seraphini TaxID=260995 RepID=A0A6P8QQB6_GEOSA|nr:mucin-13 isoform X5 [Geotrypetes seraphini]
MRGRFLLLLCNLAFCLQGLHATSSTASTSKATTTLNSETTVSTAAGNVTSATSKPETTVSTAAGNVTSPPSKPETTTAAGNETSPPSKPETTVSTGVGNETSPPSKPETTVSTGVGNETSPPSKPETTVSTAAGSETSPPSKPETTVSTAAGSETSPPSKPETTVSTAAGSETSPPSKPETTVSTAAGSETSPPSKPETTVSTAAGSETSPPSKPETTVSTAAGNETSPPSKPETTVSTAAGNETSPPSKPEITGPTSEMTSSEATSSTVSPAPCDENPCGNVKCINTAKSYICQCPFAYFFNSTEQSCDIGKSFYGKLTLNETYNATVQNTSSLTFQTLYDNVTKFFKDCFNRSDYGQTVISEIGPETPSSRTRNAAHGTHVKVINMFRQNSNISEDEVDAKINEIIKSYNYIQTFKKSDVCGGRFYCDIETTICNITTAQSTPICACKDGYYPNALVVTACRACEADCGATGTMTYCQLQDTPVCKCQPNYSNTTGKCEPCSFGYSGEDCKDAALLIVVIVIVVCGVIMLALIGAVISLKLKKNGSSQEKRYLLSNQDPVDRINPTGPFTFPKVQMQNAAAANKQASNPYEREAQFTRHVPKRDYDDEEGHWYEMTNNNTKNQLKF